MRILYFQHSAPIPALTEACLSLTHKIYTPTPHTLYLDISETEKLLGGEHAILQKALARADALRLSPQLVLTDRIEWAASFAFKTHTLLPKGKSYAALLTLPIERLAYCGNPMTFEAEVPIRTDLIRFMRRLGFYRIQNYVQLSPASISKRFGKLGIEIWEWATEKRECLLPIYTMPEIIQESLSLEDVSSLDELLFTLRQAMVNIELRLLGRDRLAKQVDLLFTLDSREKYHKNLFLSEPLRDATHLLRLLRDFLESTHWESPLRDLDITVSDTVQNVKGQLSLFDQEENRFSDLSTYLSRLQNRYGNDCAGVPLLLESHLPERSFTLQNISKKHSGTSDAPLNENRPLFLYHPPRLFQEYARAKLVPSEHLACEWWKDPHGFRQYFIAHTHRKETLWVYFDHHEKAWYVHGTFD